jgi:hypothetical protein
MSKKNFISGFFKKCGGWIFSGAGMSGIESLNFSTGLSGQLLKTRSPEPKKKESHARRSKLKI